MNPDLIHAREQTSRAQAIASIAHRGVTDKAGAPYIDHPRAVAAAFDPVIEWIEYSAALLHDTIEDTDITADDLIEAGVDAVVVETVVLLSRHKDVSDADYYARIKAHPTALRVKLADIDHNTQPDRSALLDPDSRERLRIKYAKARAALA